MEREAGERDKREVSWLQANILAHSNTTALVAGCFQARPHWPAPPCPGPSLALPSSMPPALQLGTVCSSLTGFTSYQSNGGFSSNGRDRIVPQPFPSTSQATLHDSCKAESLLWKPQPLSQQISGVLWRGTLASRRAQLCSNVCSHGPCAFLTAAMV